MDLIDEQHITLFEVRQDSRKVSRALDGGSTGGFDVRAQLVCHHGGKGGLAQARRSREQDVVRNVAALLRSLNQDGKRLLDLRLAEIVA